MGHYHLVEVLLVTTLIIFWLIIIIKFSRDRKSIKESKTRGFQDVVDSVFQEEREKLLRAIDEMYEKIDEMYEKLAVTEKKIREDKTRRERHCESPTQSHSNMKPHVQGEVSDYHPSPSRSNDSYSDSSDSSSGSSSSAGSGSSSSD